MIISNTQISSLEGQNDWDYADLRPAQTLWGPHGYHRYPAKFIPQLVRRIIDEYSNPGDLVGDPFLGSATTGVEALRSGRKFWGADVNPVALLISQTKCRPINPQYLNKWWEKLRVKLENAPLLGRRTLTDNEKDIILGIDIARAQKSERLAYWFPQPYYQSLDWIFDRVSDLSDPEIRTFFLCAFSNILRSCSIWLSGSTKPQKDLSKILSDPPLVFAKQCRDMIKRNKLYWEDILNPCSFENCYLALADTKQLPLRSGTLDLLVTSPPYATCYEYTELHQLTELWLNEHHLLSVGWWQTSCIGSRSCTPKDQSTIKSNGATNSSIADAILDELDDMVHSQKNSGIARDARALHRYFHDMSIVVKEFCRVVGVGKYLVLVLGNSYKRGVCIKTSEAITEMALSHQFSLVNKITRKVPGKVLVSTRDRKTGRFSSIANSDAQVYTEEDILVLRRLP